jgi:hypothetical protein
VLASGFGASGCGLGVSGLGAAAGDASVDVAADVDEGPDGAVGPQDGEAPGDEDGSTQAESGPPAGPMTMASPGEVTQASGLAQQTHLVYATGAARWWLFWFDASQPTQLQASSSPDFATWTPATPLVLPGSHANQGGDLSVAYASIAGVDVVHVAMGLHFTAANDRRIVHVRATLSGGAILYGSPQQLAMVSDPNLVDPDGTAVLVGPDDHVRDATGWANYLGTGNEVAWASTAADLGASWDGNFGLQQNIATASNTVNARVFAVVPPGGTVLALWELADAEPDPTNVAWSQLGTTGWSNAANVFSGKSQSANDWDVATVGAGDVRVARRGLDGSFDHVRFDGQGWTTLQAPPSDPGLAESGVVVLANAPHVAVFAIGSDPASSVRQIVWDGTQWGSWSTLEGSTATRRALAGCDAPGHTALLWTETGSAGTSIVGMPVAF